jgi:hypothetical protein
MMIVSIVSMLASALLGMGLLPIPACDSHLQEQLSQMHAERIPHAADSDGPLFPEDYSGTAWVCIPTPSGKQTEHWLFRTPGCSKLRRHVLLRGAPPLLKAVVKNGKSSLGGDELKVQRLRLFCTWGSESISAMFARKVWQPSPT